MTSVAAGRRRWIWAVAVPAVIGIVAVLAPAWYYGSDAGWLGCGSMLAKSQYGPGCEEIGVFRDRLVFACVAIGLAATVYVVGFRRFVAPERRRSLGMSSGVAAAALVVTGVALWADNNFKLPPLPNADADFRFVPSEPVDAPGTYTFVVSGTGWNASTEVIVTQCKSDLQHCDIANAVVARHVDGAFEVELEVTVEPQDTLVAVFDESRRWYAFVGVTPGEYEPPHG